MNIKINPPTIYQAFMILMLVAYFALPRSRIIQFPYNLLGLLAFVFGACIAIKAKKQFQEAGTPMSPSAQPNRLHTTGLFSVSRNPMYLGITIGLFGWAIVFSSAWKFVFPVLFLVLMDFIYIKPEEQILAQSFGDDYDAYRKRVRRWI